MGDDEEIVVRILVAEGILSPDEAQELARAAVRDGEGVLDRLRAGGRVSESTLASLCARIDHAAPASESVTSGLDLMPLDLPRPRPRATPPEVHAVATALVEARPESAAADAAPVTDAEPDGFPVPSWDRYAPIRLLGQGGMGRVFLARDLRLGRDVALKFMLGDDPELARRIVAEARAQARVNHERVCKVYEVGEVRGRVYIAMQYIGGRSLAELGSELTLEQKVIVMREAALGMAEAHRVGLIHRDLKPSNIMVERAPDGELRPYVMDFGVARDWAPPRAARNRPSRSRTAPVNAPRTAPKSVYRVGLTVNSALGKLPECVGTAHAADTRPRSVPQARALAGDCAQRITPDQSRRERIAPTWS